MKRPILSLLLCLLLNTGLHSCIHVNEQQVPEFVVENIKGFPIEEEGYELGVSACFAGVLGDKLIMAGGCNFPNMPAAEGGAKKFYQGIYCAELKDNIDSLEWKLIGELPYSSAYGVTISLADELVCIGGSNETGKLNKVCSIKWSDNKAIVDSLPDLPWPIDNMCGSLYQDKIIIAGGTKNNQPSNQALSLTLTDLEKGWTVLTDFSGNARVQPVAFASDSIYYLFGGFAGSTTQSNASLNTDGIKWREKWIGETSGPMLESGEVISLGGGTAVRADSFALAMGGVHKDIFLGALQREQIQKEAIDLSIIDSLKMEGYKYMTQPQEWYGFNKHLFLFDLKTETWHNLGSHSSLARAGAVAVIDGLDIYLIGGELKPGIRTPDIVRVKINMNIN